MLQDSANQNIIVYTSFSTAIEANLAKTKLDAYGIPCFLSDENLAGLYPLSFFKAGQVRLHVFEQDAPRVKEILEEQAGE